jgi:predicted O-methyltransferase YrrM
MKDKLEQSYPEAYSRIKKSTAELGFTMASDVLTCSLLRTLAATKPSGKFLEMGTGTGLATSWILDGMDMNSTLISVDNDERLHSIAKENLGNDNRLELICLDGGDWILKCHQKKFDYIFADTWHGKYLMLDEILTMLNKGGLYILDDMLPQSNWPSGHEEKVNQLISNLANRNDLTITQQNWATGIIIATKK